MEKINKKQLVVYGAICGDIIGEEYEGYSTKDYDFEMFFRDARFTDDTVCTIAIADALTSDYGFAESLKYWCRKYPHAGYGGTFRRWLRSETLEPYNSWGNGSAMRVSPVGVIGNSGDEVLELAKQSAEVTHNHPEGVKGAQATALAIFLALEGKSKNDIKTEIENRFGYDLDRKYDDIQPGYRFDVSCQGSVPESIICFLESEDYESTIRKAIAMGGDSDTMAAIAGGIAAAYYGSIPEPILNHCLPKVPEEMKKVVARL